jgi:hypothetical protein
MIGKCDDWRVAALHKRTRDELITGARFEVEDY